MGCGGLLAQAPAPIARNRGGGVHSCFGAQARMSERNHRQSIEIPPTESCPRRYLDHPRPDSGVHITEIRVTMPPAQHCVRIVGASVDYVAFSSDELVSARPEPCSNAREAPIPCLDRALSLHTPSSMLPRSSAMNGIVPKCDFSEAKGNTWPQPKHPRQPVSRGIDQYAAKPRNGRGEPSR